MFTSPIFNDTLNSFTLRFHSQKIEELYQSSVYDECWKYFSPFCAMLLSLIGFIAILAYLTVDSYGVYDPEDALYYMCATIACSAFTVLEAIVVSFKKLKSLRSIFLSIGICSSVILASINPHRNPIFRPATIGALMIAMVGSFFYSFSWIIGSLEFLIGILALTVVYMKQMDVFAPKTPHYMPFLSIGLALWIVPYLLYCWEKRARYSSFLQWCSNKVTLY